MSVTQEQADFYRQHCPHDKVVRGFCTCCNKAVSTEPLDSDGNPMPICKGCGAKFPQNHNYDCPEAQE